jgi:putative tricarboxylic transport membrane protein
LSDPWLQALSNVFQFDVLAVIVLAATYGLFVGAIPGLTATMAVALLVPFTFFLGETPALAAIVTLEACAIFAGDIPTALVRIPGTPSSAAYADDAYAMTRRGRSDEALGTALVFSVVGGLLGALVLMALAPQLARVAFYFTTYEYFWLTLLGLSCAAIVSQGSRLKGAVALVIGLLLSTVGLSAVHSTPRFTFGRDELITGVNFIPAMIGLFGVSEVLRNAIVLAERKGHADAETTIPAAGGGGGIWSFVVRSIGAVFAAPLRLLRERKVPCLRSSAIGSLVGMLPGAGADIGAWISYAVSKRFSKNPTEYGKGSAEGLADATCANNSALAGAWVPSLVFGIPGDSITAIVIGVLLMKNVSPGPEIFEKQPELVYGIYITFVLANLLLLPLGFLAISCGRFLVRLPRRVLLPMILLFSIVGSYAIGGSFFDVGVMLGMGVLGFALESCRVPLGPVVLGIILGGRLEEYFIQNLTKSDSFFDFFSRPLAGLLGSLTLILWLTPLFRALVRRTRKPGGSI